MSSSHPSLEGGELLLGDCVRLGDDGHEVHLVVQLLHGDQVERLERVPRRRDQVQAAVHARVLIGRASARAGARHRFLVLLLASLRASAGAVGGGRRGARRVHRQRALQTQRYPNKSEYAYCKVHAALLVCSSARQKVKR